MYTGAQYCSMYLSYPLTFHQHTHTHTHKPALLFLLCHPDTPDLCVWSVSVWSVSVWSVSVWSVSMWSVSV